MAVFAAYVIIAGVASPYFAGYSEKGYVDLSKMQAAAMERESSYIRNIDDNVDALLWRIKLIGEAQEEIVLTSFDFRADNSGCDIIAALYDAAQRGVKVRILADGLSAMFRLEKSGELAALTALPNVEMRIYNSVKASRLWEVNYRMHDKYLIIDGYGGIIGGRNTNDFFMGEYSEVQNLDRDILVWEKERETDGFLPVLKEYFEGVWSLDCCSEFIGGGGKDMGDELSARYRELLERYEVKLSELSLKAEGMYEAKISMIYNPTGNVKKAPLLWNELCGLMENGELITIETPYIICGRDMYDDLEALAADRTVEVITNSPAGGANPWGCSDFLRQKKKLIKIGVTPYEFLGNKSLHTKAVLIDDNISVVGSFNTDMRSAYLDTELMLVIESTELNAELRAAAEAQKASVGIYSDMSAGRRIVFNVLGIIIIPVRYLL